MADEKVKKIVLVKMPSFTRLLIGGLMAYWLSTIMNPAFVAISVLVVLLIPVLTVDNIFSRQFTKAYNPPVEVQPKVITKSEYIEMKTAKEAKDAPPVEVKKTNILKEMQKTPPAEVKKTKRS
ncbi:MAG: hypothetical protein PHD53_07800 [Methylococcales bacterium]|nr:hypothetical protein [Methylococcales bacterium]